MGLSTYNTIYSLGIAINDVNVLLQSQVYLFIYLKFLSNKFWDTLVAVKLSETDFIPLSSKWLDLE